MNSSVLELFTGLSAVNGPPTAGTDGKPTGGAFQAGDLTIFGTADAATDEIEARLWGFTLASMDSGSQVWLPLTVVNNGDAIVADISIGGNDVFRYSEHFINLAGFDRLYLEVTAVTGTVSLEATMTRTKKPAERE